MLREYTWEEISESQELNHGDKFIAKKDHDEFVYSLEHEISCLRSAFDSSYKFEADITRDEREEKFK